VQVLLKHMKEKQAVEVAHGPDRGPLSRTIFRSRCRWARELGLKVSTEMPRLVYDLMDLYPQGGGVRPSVWYVPLRRPPVQGRAGGSRPCLGNRPCRAPPPRTRGAGKVK